MFVLSIPCKDTIELYSKKENAIARLLSEFAKDCFCGPDIDEEFTFLKKTSTAIPPALDGGLKQTS